MALVPTARVEVATSLGDRRRAISCQGFWLETKLPIEFRHSSLSNVQLCSQNVQNPARKRWVSISASCPENVRARQALGRKPRITGDMRKLIDTDKSPSSIDRFLSGRALQNGLFDGCIWPKGAVSPRSPMAQQRRQTFPLPAAVIPRGTRKSLLCCQGPAVRRRSPPAGRSPSRPQWCGLERQ